MGANAVTTVYDFTAGQVLTAAQMDNVNCGIPVFATTTTRDAAFGGTGEKTLAEGQFAYIEATNTTQYYDGSTWQAVGASGLTRIATTTSSAASTVTLDNVFSSTYKHYLITYNYQAGTTETMRIQFRYGTTTQAANYYAGQNTASFNGSTGALSTNNGTFVQLSGGFKVLSGQLFVSGVGNTSEKVSFTSQSFEGQNGGSASGGGYCDTAQTFTGFIFTNSSGGTIFTGTVSVYGLALS